MWVTAFEELIKWGYQPTDHGQIILNAYIDHKLETRLGCDKPMEAGITIKGPEDALDTYCSSSNKTPENWNQ